MIPWNPPTLTSPEQGPLLAESQQAMLAPAASLTVAQPSRYAPMPLGAGVPDLSSVLARPPRADLLVAFTPLHEYRTAINVKGRRDAAVAQHAPVKSARVGREDAIMLPDIPAGPFREHGGWPAEMILGQQPVIAAEGSVGSLGLVSPSLPSRIRSKRSPA